MITPEETERSADQDRSELNAIIAARQNPVAVKELEGLRRIERWARALVDSWQHGDGPDDIRRPGICVELEAAVAALRVYR